MDFEYKGVKAAIPQEMIDDVTTMYGMGINIPDLLKTSVDKMLRIAGTETGDFRVAMQIRNPSCEPR